MIFIFCKALGLGSGRLPVCTLDAVAGPSQGPNRSTTLSAGRRPGRAGQRDDCSRRLQQPPAASTASLQPSADRHGETGREGVARRGALGAAAPRWRSVSCETPSRPGQPDWYERRGYVWSRVRCVSASVGTRGGASGRRDAPRQGSVSEGGREGSTPPTGKSATAPRGSPPSAVLWRETEITSHKKTKQKTGSVPSRSSRR